MKSICQILNKFELNLIMNINPLDILLVVFLIITISLGFKNGLLIELKKTGSLLGSAILSNIIIKSLANKFYFLQSGVDIFYLSTFLVIFILIVLGISFLIDMIMEESDELVIEKYANIGLGSILGLIRGAVIITLLLFVFDTTPIEEDDKQSIYDKIQSKSVLFKQFTYLKSILLKD